MAHELPALPYAQDALEPHISARTISFHYGKHHQGYVTKLNAAVGGTDKEGLTLEELITSSEGGLFNNAAQVWNHTFYWNCLSPNGGGAPTGAIAEKINAKWGSFDAFKAAFAAAAAGNFGSGWTWLVESNGELDILNTDDADTPLRHGKKALLTFDVWEHAYYLDYQNGRGNYVDALWNLVNWDFVNAQ